MPQTTNIAIKPTAKQKAEQLQLHLTTSPQTHDWPFERLAKDSPHHSALYVLYVLYVHSVHPVHNVHNVLYVLYVHPVHKIDKIRPPGIPGPKGEKECQQY